MKTRDRLGVRIREIIIKIKHDKQETMSFLLTAIVIGFNKKNLVTFSLSDSNTGIRRDRQLGNIAGGSLHTLARRIGDSKSEFVEVGPYWQSTHNVSIIGYNMILQYCHNVFQMGYLVVALLFIVSFQFATCDSNALGKFVPEANKNSGT